MDRFEHEQADKTAMRLPVRTEERRETLGFPTTTGGNLRRSPRQQCRELGPMLSATGGKKSSKVLKWAGHNADPIFASYFPFVCLINS
jgi:hypothetical protein